MAKHSKSAPAEAPDTGASRVKKFDKATARLLEQVGELVIGGRLYVLDSSGEPRSAASVRADAEAPDDKKESESVG